VAICFNPGKKALIPDQGLHLLPVENVGVLDIDVLFCVSQEI
jgi:hypothetical protein